MKRIALAITLGFDLVSASWAAETVNTHERVNNTQAPAYQIRSISVPSVVQRETSRMAGMNQHEQAIIAHETMNNGSAEAHQGVAKNRQKMMGNTTANDTRPSVSFVAMSEHGRAAVAHEAMNDGQSGAHQAMAETHRCTINAD